jgi:hypothetical protein
VDGDRIAGADGIDTFVRLALDAHVLDRNAHRPRKVCAHRLDVRQEFRTLGDDDDVDIADVEPCTGDDPGGLGEERQTIGVLPCGIRVGKMPADVAGRGGAKNGVGDRMAHRVRIGMAVQSLLEWNSHASQHETTAVDQPMQIVAVADTERVRSARRA